MIGLIRAARRSVCDYFDIFKVFDVSTRPTWALCVGSNCTLFCFHSDLANFFFNESTLSNLLLTILKLFQDWQLISHIRSSTRPTWSHIFLFKIKLMPSDPNTIGIELELNYKLNIQDLINCYHSIDSHHQPSPRGKDSWNKKGQQLKGLPLPLRYFFAQRLPPCPPLVMIIKSGGTSPK